MASNRERHWFTFFYLVWAPHVYCSWRCLHLCVRISFVQLLAYIHLLFRFNKFNLLWISIFRFSAWHFMRCRFVQSLFNFFSTRPLPISHRNGSGGDKPPNEATAERREKKTQQHTTHRLHFHWIHYTRHTISPALVCTLFDVDTGPCYVFYSASYALNPSKSRYTGSTSIKCYIVYTPRRARKTLFWAIKYTKSYITKEQCALFPHTIRFFLSLSPFHSLFFGCCCCCYSFIFHFHTQCHIHIRLSSLISVSVVDIFSCFVIFARILRPLYNHTHT